MTVVKEQACQNQAWYRARAWMPQTGAWGAAGLGYFKLSVPFLKPNLASPHFCLSCFDISVLPLTETEDSAEILWQTLKGISSPCQAPTFLHAVHGQGELPHKVIGGSVVIVLHHEAHQRQLWHPQLEGQLLIPARIEACRGCGKKKTVTCQAQQPMGHRAPRHSHHSPAK